MEQYRNRIKAVLRDMADWRYTHIQQVEPRWIREGDYRFSETFEKGEEGWKPFSSCETWGGTDSHFWIYAKTTLPEEYEGKKAVLMVSTGATDIWNTDNPQFLVYINGKMAATMDMNHHTITLSEQAKAGEEYEIVIYAYSNVKIPTNFLFEKIAVLRPDVEKLYYDMKVPFEAAELMREDEIDRNETLAVLNRCLNLLDLRQVGSEAFYASVREADTFLEHTLYSEENPCGIAKNPVTVHSIGHTHIDVAWKWPLRQTRQKTVRSFQTVLNLMKEYPEYLFMSSQPQLYQFVKEDAPWLYEQIKERVKEGRWEPEGAMWLEADCNLTGGESLIRQILYGKKFFKEEFGVETQEILWLPDVFGYSVALPQILKKSGIRYFMTTKIAWNEYNKMPNDVMMWQGLDGSEILTYFISTTNYQVYPELVHNGSFNTTYNGRQNANQVKGTWQRFQNKELTQDVLTCFGYGDGGGGPTAEMLEESRRMEKGVCGCPRTKQTSVREFFHILEKNLEGKKVPKWCGELYLEFHRGTYTSIAKNKKNNRKCEFLNVDAELWSVLAKSQDASFAYPKDRLEEAWKLVLLNQFHDILPGSSIKDVYEDSDIQYARVRALDEAMIAEARDSLHRSLGLAPASKKNAAVCVYNDLGFARGGIVELPEIAGEWNPQLQKAEDGKVLYLLPDCAAPKGITVFQGLQQKDYEAEEKVIFGCISLGVTKLAAFDTPFYYIHMSPEGEFLSIYDKEAQREIVKQGSEVNRLMVFEDRPLEYDAWNIDAYFEEKSWCIDQVESIEIVENGPVRGAIAVRKRFMNSVVEQRIYFYRHTKRIDFKTKVDWKEQQLLLKAVFSVDVLSPKATYEVQFGNVERPTHKNTSWDEAKFEVCAHKWADLSEYGYGVALLNDCKYGCDIHDSVMRLTLIKSGIFPNPDADKEIHTFTYSLYPHQGDFREGRVVQEAYDLNCPLQAELVGAKEGSSLSLVQIDADHVVVETVKQAENEDGIVIRMYEAYGKRGNVTMRLPMAEGRRDVYVWECDCMETEIKENGFRVLDGTMKFEIHPYEIKTWKVKIQKS